LPHSVVDRLTHDLHEEMRAAAPGACLRVDFLDREDCERLCRELRRRREGQGVETYVLLGDRTEDDLYLLPEQAIEVRNRKRYRLCLFVPAGIVDAAASSLANSFAAFDLEGWFRDVARQLVAGLA